MANREGNYADCRPMFDKIAAMWSAYLGVTITRKDASYMLELFKIARIKAGNWQHDNGIDNINYAALAYVVESLGDDGINDLINDSIKNVDNDIVDDTADSLLEKYPHLNDKIVWDKDRYNPIEWNLEDKK